MDTDNLDYSYLEQALILVQRLKDGLSSEPDDDVKCDAHRLFRHNPFQEITQSERQHLDKQLQRCLIMLGCHINSKNTVMVVDKRNMDNYTYGKNGVIKSKPSNSVKFTACKPRRSFIMLHVIAKVINLLQNDKYMTNRELYYLSKDICGSRVNGLNKIIEDLCCLVGCSRIHLRIVCQAKGLVFGHLKFEIKSGEVFDCMTTKEGMRVPTPQNPIVDIQSDAKFILIVEKDCVLQKMINQEESTNFVNDYKAIIFTAKGYPDVNSRAFLNLIWRKLNIPVFALTDADPYGMEIACCYKFGCYSSASEASYLTLPQMKWLGLLPSDVAQHTIPESRMINLTDSDEKKIQSLLKRPYLKTRPDWLDQLHLMRKVGKKAELESIDIEGDYLTRTYIPNKLRYASWL